MANVIITGSNSGLGMAAALAFARRGDTVFATVRDELRATALASCAEQEKLDIRIRTLDVTRPATFAEKIAAIVKEAGTIDVLVNNAGVLIPGAWEDLSEEQARQVMETNFFGPMLLVQAVLPQLRQQRSGYIIMISSLSGLAGLAGDVAYTASKFALEGATEALRHEIDRWNIKLALVEAGQYATELFRCGGNLPAEYPGASPYRELVESKLQQAFAGRASALAPERVGELLLTITESEGDQLRWAADDVARHVLNSVHRHSDSERDSFLRGASDSDWWSQGMSAPPLAEPS